MSCVSTWVLGGWVLSCRRRGLFCSPSPHSCCSQFLNGTKQACLCGALLPAKAFGLKKFLGSPVKVPL